MKQYTLVAPKTFEVSEVEIPECLADQALLKVRAVGICGSDIHAYYGKHPYMSFPITLGHEATGEVVRVGENVSNVKVGDRVVMRPQKVCGTCRSCREGHYNECRTLEVLGCQCAGASSNYYAVKAELLYRIPDKLSYEVGTILEPLAVGIRAAQRAGDVTGKNVLILGDGTIGNVVMQSAKALGAAKVMIAGHSDYKLSMARECGADIAVNTTREDLPAAVEKEFGPEGLDIVYECSGSGAALNQMLECGRKRMKFVIVAVYSQMPAVNMGLVQDREYEFYGSLMYLHEDYLTAIRLVEEGKIDLERLLTRTFPIEEVAEAYQFIEQNKRQVQKIVLRVNGEAP